MTKPIFLTLQRGDHIYCLRLGLPHLALGLSLSLVLAISLSISRPFEEDNGLAESKWRIAALQSELEKSVSQNGVTADLLHTGLKQAFARLARVDAQEAILQSMNSMGLSADQPLQMLDQQLSQVERHHITRLQEATSQRVAQTHLIEGALQQAGLQVMDPPDNMSKAQGGPFLPLTDAVSEKFADEWSRAEPHIIRHASLTSVLPFLPLRAPLAGPMEMSSGFGARMDPFHGRAAWHTGIDLRQDVGSDVLATASGTVIAVGRNGAYGLTVDVDHGHGLVTRYAHLSRALVREGQTVQANMPLGRSGASGRTTGAHLHYELRINGEPTNPVRLLKAGQMIAPLLNANSRASETAQ